MLSFINCLLPRIRVPTSILGKALFGHLKADECPNLFTIQLPALTLPVYWAEGGITGHSLFCSFAHLVSSPIPLSQFGVS
ncbi:uncharacterized protein VP01_4140g2 [Puccinia sorghi]|uniref:Uncharacterized protein n=1 Tax=Puccinia sorghi TaxID=27349 RepID=A0A0L6UR36_9BASI|nr:uncharacterized protein VP01_4140g2 [Puccinia sorghi]